MLSNKKSNEQKKNRGHDYSADDMSNIRSHGRPKHSDHPAHNLSCDRSHEYNDHHTSDPNWWRPEYQKDPKDIEKWQYDCHSDRSLTLIKKRVLLWLIMMCDGKQKDFISFYQRIGSAVGISKRAARVHIAALEKKKFISTSIIYLPRTKQPIGKTAFVTRHAPIIKSLQKRLSKAEKQKAWEMKQKYNRNIKLIAKRIR